MPPEIDAGQPVEQPTGPQGAAGTSTPAQPASQAQPQPPAGAAPPGEDWHKRYVGLQQGYQETVEDLKKAQALLQQYSQHAGTLEQQLAQTQQERGSLTQNLEQTQVQLGQFQQETQFWNIVSNEFPDLFALASVLQRVTDPAQQRQILQTARERMGGTVTQQVNRQVSQQFAGVTPGASPPAQQPLNQFPAKEEVLRQLDINPINSPEYKRWKEVWERHPENNPASLNPGFVDPFQSDWDKVRKGEEMVVVQDLTQTQGPWAPGGPLNPRS